MKREVSFLSRLLQQPDQIHCPDTIKGGLLWSLAILWASSVGCQAQCLQILLPAWWRSSPSQIMCQAWVQVMYVSGSFLDHCAQQHSSVSSSEPILVLALFASLSAKLWVLVISHS